MQNGTTVSPKSLTVFKIILYSLFIGTVVIVATGAVFALCLLLWYCSKEKVKGTTIDEKKTEETMEKTKETEEQSTRKKKKRQPMVASDKLREKSRDTERLTDQFKHAVNKPPVDKVFEIVDEDKHKELIEEKQAIMRLASKGYMPTYTSKKKVFDPVKEEDDMDMDMVFSILQKSKSKEEFKASRAVAAKSTVGLAPQKRMSRLGREHPGSVIVDLNTILNK